MGNEASTALKAANVQRQFTSAIDGLNKVPTKEAPRNNREMKEREKEREAEYERRKEEREQRKSQVAQRWSQHRKTNVDCEAPGKLQQSWIDVKQKAAEEWKEIAEVAEDAKKNSSWWSGEKNGSDEDDNNPKIIRETPAERLSRINAKSEKQSKNKTPSKKQAASPSPAGNPVGKAAGGGGAGGSWWEE